MHAVSGGYVCRACGWKGSRISEQAIKLMPVDALWRFQDGVTRPGSLGPVIVYACYKCGAPVKPS